MNFSFGSTSNIDTRITIDIQFKISTSKIFVVSKKRCGACKKAKKLLNKEAVQIGVVPVVFDLDKYSKQQVQMIINYLSASTGIRTVPQIWINGRFIGGNDDIQQIQKEGRLVSIILGTMKNGPTNHERKLGVSRNGPWYQPSKFTIDDDRKYDLPLQKSQSERWGKSDSSTGWGANLSKSIKRLGSSWFHSTSSETHKSPQPQSVPVSVGDSYWLDRPVVGDNSFNSSGNEGFIFSTMI